MNNTKTLENLEKLYDKYNNESATKTSKDVAEAVSACDKGRSWKWRYMLSLKNGMVLRPRVSKAINKAAAKIKPPKPKPLPNQISKRTLVIYATLDELHEIQDRYTPLDRANRLLEER